MALSCQSLREELHVFANGLLRKELAEHRKEMLKDIEQFLAIQENVPAAQRRQDSDSCGFRSMPIVSGLSAEPSHRGSACCDRTLGPHDGTYWQMLEDEEHGIMDTISCAFLQPNIDSREHRALLDRTYEEIEPNESANRAKPHKKNLQPSAKKNLLSFRDLLRSLLAREWKHIVESAQFDYGAGSLVCFNALLLGIEADIRMQEASLANPPNFELAHEMIHIVNGVLCFCFSFELIIRFCAYGCGFFIQDDWKWNVFDLVVVGVQVFETAIDHLGSKYAIGREEHVASILRIARLLRITRLVRVLRLFLELRTLVISIVGSMKELFWTLVLLATVIYAFSVFFTELVAEHLDFAKERGQSQDTNDMVFYFGSLARTALTLIESILGGVSWDDPANLLINEVSPWIGLLLCVYVAFCIFALSNVVTGIFIQKSMQLAQAEKETTLTEHITTYFMSLDRSGDGNGVDIETFREGLQDEHMAECFEEISVNPLEADGIFELLDSDGGGSLDADEIIDGLLRLKGPATALELALLAQQTQNLIRSMKDSDVKRNTFVLNKEQFLSMDSG